MPFICISGVNGTGKSTQLKRISKYIQSLGLTFVVVKYPVYNLDWTGPFLWNYLRDVDGFRSKKPITAKELQEIFFQNRQDYESHIKFLLDQGFVVLVEDYIVSAVVWSFVSELDIEWSLNLNSDLLKTDINIILNGDLHSSSYEKNHLNEGDDKRLEVARKLFVDLCDYDRTINCPGIHHLDNYHLVNSNGSKKDVTNRIIPLIKPLVLVA